MFLHFLNHILDTFLKFTSVLASRNHTGKIQNHKTFIFHCIRNHSHDNTLSKPFNDSCFTNPRLTNQTWIVLSSSAQNLDKSGNLFITSYYWVKLSFCGKLCQIAAVLIQSRGACHLFISCILCILKFLCNRIIIKSHRCQNRCKKFLDIYSHCKQQSGSYAVCLFQKCKQQMFCSADAFHALCIFLRLLNDSL